MATRTKRRTVTIDRPISPKFEKYTCDLVCVICGLVLIYSANALPSRPCSVEPPRQRTKFRCNRFRAHRGITLPYMKYVFQNSIPKGACAFRGDISRVSPRACSASHKTSKGCTEDAKDHHSGRMCTYVSDELSNYISLIYDRIMDDPCYTSRPGRSLPDP